MSTIIWRRVMGSNHRNVPVVRLSRALYYRSTNPPIILRKARDSNSDALSRTSCFQDRCRYPDSFGLAFLQMVEGEGIEPSRPKAQNFKSCASTNFTTPRIGVPPEIRTPYLSVMSRLLIPLKLEEHNLVPEITT